MPDATMTHDDDTPQRTSALAFWRYAHDYLRSAKSLTAKHDLRPSESQVVHHLLAQSLAFVATAWLRARDVPLEAVERDTRGALSGSLARARSLGLPAWPAETAGDVERLAAQLTETSFRFAPEAAAPRVDEVCAAITHLLDAIVADVARDYAERYASDGSPSAEDFVRRLKADLSATVGRT